MKRWIALFAACALAACAMPAPRAGDANGAGIAAESPAGSALPSSPPAPAATCQPDPYCNRDCLRGYSAAYCRYKCGC